MSYYQTCPYCGAHLDPGERCDCRDNEKAAPRATNTQSGKREQVLTGLVSATSVHETGRDVKGGGFGYVQARRLADMMTPGQRKDILLLAHVIQETSEGGKEENKWKLYPLTRFAPPLSKIYTPV